MDKYREEIQEKYGFDPGECINKFQRSVKEHYESQGFLSPKQIAHLKKPQRPDHINYYPSITISSNEKQINDMSSDPRAYEWEEDERDEDDGWK